MRIGAGGSSVPVSMVLVSVVVDGQAGRPTGMQPSISAVVTAQLSVSHHTTTMAKRIGVGACNVVLFSFACKIQDIYT